MKSFPLLFVLAAFLPAAGSLPSQDAPAPRPPPAGPTLVFQSDELEYDAKPDDAGAPFAICVTNVWTNSIVIESVHASCRCTVATLPQNPWILAPGAGGVISATVDLADKDGTVIKVLTFSTSVGDRMVTLKVVLPPPARPGDEPLTAAERLAAMKKAAADPQAIFRGGCASCHADKGRGLLGQNLYAASCGVCHDSPHRASMVPDLRALNRPANLDYWKTIIANGKPRTMMPAFAAARGGPLTDMQISSLSQYLDQTISHHLPPR